MPSLASEITISFPGLKRQGPPLVKQMTQNLRKYAVPATSFPLFISLVPGMIEEPGYWKRKQSEM